MGVVIKIALGIALGLFIFVIGMAWIVGGADQKLSEIRHNEKVIKECNSMMSKIDNDILSLKKMADALENSQDENDIKNVRSLQIKVENELRAYQKKCGAEKGKLP